MTATTPENIDLDFDSIHLSTPSGPQSPSREKRPLKLNGIKPEVHHIQATDGVPLVLKRYKGGSKGPILLLHGLGVSSLIFTLDTIDTNLVEYLVEHGYDVWTLDMRYSILLSSHKREGYINVAGERDLPPAVDYIINITGSSDIQALVHCAGGATMHTALLGGHLDGKIRCLVASQAGFCITAGTLNKVKSHVRLSTSLHRLGVDGLTASPDSERSCCTRFHNFFFGGIARVTTKSDEHCSSDVCHRVTFMYNLLWAHHNLNQLTHDTLQEWNGFAHATMFRHFAACVRKGRVVDHHGHDVFLPDFHSGLKSDRYRAAMKHLDLPILYFSGVDNVCWHPDTTQRSFDRCKEANPDQHYERFEVEKYRHLDCIMGKNAATDVYPQILPFLEKYA